MSITKPFASRSHSNAERLPRPFSPAVDPLVRFVGIDKSYDGRTLVVENLNLDIARGEFLTLLGPSGSGKTTCLLMLAGFEVPTDGYIYLDGERVNAVPSHRRGIGMVFQNYALFPHMSVGENVAFPLQVRGIGRDEVNARVKRALDMVELPGLGARRPSELSGGQQQRVALARALVFEPKLVLLDEPLGALDKQLREQMQLELKHLHEALEITMVYVTHDQSEALTMSDRVAVFENGRIQQLADPQTLYERPENLFVARFIGENNSMAGRVLDVDSRTCTVCVGDQSVVHALPVDSVAPGDAVMLSLRPERVRLITGETVYPNVYEATVVEMIYLGDHTRIRLRAPGVGEFSARVSNDEEHPALRNRQPVRVAWRAQDCRAFLHS